MMDIKAELDRVKLEQAQADEAKPRENASLRTVLVAPAPSKLPEDGMLQYRTVETIYDMKDVPDRTVALFADNNVEILKVVNQHPAMFGVKLLLLSGLPAADYSLAFEDAVWNLDRVAYVTFVSDLRATQELEKTIKANEQQSTVHGRERAQVTRSNGSVKAFTGFTGPEDAATDDIGDD